MSLQQIVSLSVIKIVGDFSLKKYSNEGGILQLGLGILSYVGVIIMLIITLQGSTVLLVNAAWNGVSAIIESLAAIFILGERFNNYLQYLGIALIIGGLYLLKVPWSKEHVFYIPKI